MPEAEETLTLRVELGRTGSVQQFTDALVDLNGAYNALYYFLDLCRDIKEFLRYWPPYWHPLVAGPRSLRVARMPGKRRRPHLIIEEAEDFSTYVLPSDRLVLKACQIASPGWVDVLGKLNPLRILREYHEMRKDREYREQAEKEKLHLENALLRIQVTRELIETLKEVGFPRTQLKQIVNVVLIEPMSRFQAQVDNGYIRDLREVPSAKGGGPQQ